MRFKLRSFFAMCLLLTAMTIAISMHHPSKPKRALQKSHEKPQWKKWAEVFLGVETYDQVPSLVNLITKVSLEYLADCTPIILYDNFTENYDNLLLQKLLNNYPLAYVHGQITTDYKIKVKNIQVKQKSCVSYIIFMQDVMRCKDVIGEQNYNKVIIVARSSQWRVFEFLSNEKSQSFTNLLVIAKSEKILTGKDELPYILYTHKLYVDALGSNIPQILTSWYKGNLTQPNAVLFPKKITEGFAGHRFIIAFANQPPFVIKKGQDENGDAIFDGIEIRLVNLLSKIYNFTTDYREASAASKIGPAEAVTMTVKAKKANLGLAGLYTTDERIDTMTQWHSQDCAAFISLTSTALPRYRAIMGPFHWTVWLALSSVYLLAIIPLAFSDKHTLRHLIDSPEEIENMFWYVFGTFTNCFTFVGRGSWSNSNKVTTRLLVAFYWLFTIIITACYTGSIIAFVTLPVYPSVVDTVKQLLSGHFQVGTLDKGGWPHWFENSTDPATKRLLKDIEFLPNVESGLRNTTKAFFWPYAFLGSRAQLDYIVRTNFTTKNKRSLLHISEECFVPYSVGMILPKNSIYKEILNQGILKAVEYGFMKKLKGDVEWYMMRSATGKLLSANSVVGGLKALTVEDRALTLDDTQGMFLLLGIGFVMGGSALVSEWLGGCFKFCRNRQRVRKGSDSTIPSNPRSHEGITPRQKLDSIEYSQAFFKNHRLVSIPDLNSPNGDREKIECIVHDPIQNNNEEPNEVNEIDSDTDYEEEINKLFDNVFGEVNINDNIEQEEIEETLASACSSKISAHKYSSTHNKE